VLQRDPLFVAGAGTFVDDMLRAAGGLNLGRELPGAWPRASREWLLAAAPELIIDSTDEPEAAQFWSRWPSLRARVVSLPAGAVTLPGPRLDAALQLIERAVRGDAPSRASAP
jgi:iron complex transport system substrate-binding protein